jgi:two-component system chemotaxis sensor kinase CheA
MGNVKDIAHKMENVFGAVREGSIQVSPSLIDAMFDGLEMLKRLKSEAASEAPNSTDINAILLTLDTILDPAMEVLDNSLQFSSENGPETETAAAALLTDTNGMPAAQPSQTIRVRADRLNNLMNLIGELMIARNRLNACAEGQKDDELEAVSEAIDRLTGNLQDAITGIRMVPVEWLFNKFPGVVRNMAREANKRAVLVMDGKETELDKNVIDQMYNPLMHLIRNAVDHGIEPPEERIQSGKDPVGTIKLSARHKRNHILIEISDDGRGLQSEKIVQTAVRKGVLSIKEASEISQDRIDSLIFAPGFSTSEAVSDVSGRGVGMDAVRNQVQQLRGVVETRTMRGMGTTFSIRLPLTLSVLQVLLVKSCGFSWGIPLSSVLETLSVAASDIQTVEKQEVAFIRGNPHPLKRFGSVLHLNAPPVVASAGRGDANPFENLSIVIVNLPGKRAAICVDELMEKQEVVMKPLGDFIGHAPGIEGATILADGTITPIIDVESLLRNT